MFRFPTPEGAVSKCWRCAIGHPPMLWRSARLALGVGTILAIINHGDELVRGDWTAAVIVKVLVTYCVPFSVAASSALWNSRVRFAGEALEAMDTSSRTSEHQEQQ